MRGEGGCRVELADVQVCRPAADRALADRRVRRRTRRRASARDRSRAAARADRAARAPGAPPPPPRTSFFPTPPLPPKSSRRAPRSASSDSGGVPRRSSRALNTAEAAGRVFDAGARIRSAGGSARPISRVPIRPSAATPRGSRSSAGRMRTPTRPSRRGISERTRRSAARRGSQIGHRAPAGVIRLTIASAMVIRARRRAASPSSLSASDSCSGSRTQ